MSAALTLAGALTLVVSLCAALGVWLFGMRPYLQRHGGTVVTGANRDRADDMHDLTANQAAALDLPIPSLFAIVIGERQASEPRR